MEIVRTLTALRAQVAGLRRQAAGVALIPTMGALHDGHLALVAAGRTRGATVASIFVNPTQFARTDDLSRYPRDEAGDLAKLAAAGCDLVWMPDVETMYGAGDATTVDVAGPALGWEGDVRPGHFRGVATVVNRLLNQVQPDDAMFGEKDWQQLQVVRRMAADLRMPVRIVGVPTVREPDGLAMSSRNRFLTPDARALAPQLHAAMTHLVVRLRDGGDPAQMLPAATSTLNHAGFAVDYMALVAPDTLRAVTAYQPPARLIAAARLGAVRLLDNIAA